MSHTLQVAGPALPVYQGQPALAPVRLSGQEGVNCLFEYQLLLQVPETLDLSPTVAAGFDLNAFIGRELCCSIELDGNGTRQINALVTAARFLDPVGRLFQYQLTLHPWLHLATLTRDCKVFQNKTVVEILDELLADYPFPVEQRLYERYPQRDYQAQYNESDFDFFERLCQEWGINYHFEHSEGKHRLVLSDAMASFRPNDSAAYQQVEYHAPGWRPDAEYIHAFTPQNQLRSGIYTTSDYDYTQPRAQLQTSRSDPRPTGNAEGEVYQWHGQQGASHFAQPDSGSSAGSTAGSTPTPDPFAKARDDARLLTQLRMEQLRTAGARGQASGNLRGMQPGHTFCLAQHPREKANGEYLILHTRLLIEEVGQASQTPGQPWRVQLDFITHPVGAVLRPRHERPKPIARGPHVALVVGPTGESSATGQAQNIWTDALGRIKVQFPWDRRGRRNQHSSCWVRMSTPMSGNQMGTIALPRIGQEVVVQFIGGDPDLPICTGQLANAVNMPPWRLPGQSALSGIRSRELTEGAGNSAAGRSNHLILDDTPGQIQVQLKSDHQHSSLSLGHITRIDAHEGRQDHRGEGFELRTDGHGVARAGKGMLITTEGREAARGAIKDMGETATRLEQAQVQHEMLEDLATQHGAWDELDQPTSVSQSLQAQNKTIRGEGQANPAKGYFPELSEPHLVLASSAGIQATAEVNVALDAQQHVATTSGAHTSVVAKKSVLMSALKGLRLFAYNSGVRLFARKGPIQIQSQSLDARLVAKRMIELISEGRIDLKARKGIILQAQGSTLIIDKQGFRFYSPNGHRVYAGEHGTSGPQSVRVDLPEMPVSYLEQGPYSAKYQLFKTDNRPFNDYAYQVLDAKGAHLQAMSTTAKDGRTPVIDTEQAKAVHARMHLMRESERITEPWNVRLEQAARAAASAYLDAAG